MAKRLRIGDVVELPVKSRFAYAQLTHVHPRFGPLIRVLETMYLTRPESIESIANDSTRFVTFLPLQQIIARGIFSLVGNAEVPVAAAKFPVFRAGVKDPSLGKVRNWWLWDGEREWMVGELEGTQRAMPIRGIMNDTLLIERIASNWRPLNDAE